MDTLIRKKIELASVFLVQVVGRLSGLLSEGHQIPRYNNSVPEVEGKGDIQEDLRDVATRLLCAPRQIAATSPLSSIWTLVANPE
jgi:hypothetical protein